jgi:Kef-type K+ transport system membrane component KefB
MRPGHLHLLYNRPALAALSGIRTIAVLAFGLITGLHLEPGIFRDSGRAPLSIAAGSIVVPTSLGSVAGYWILARHLEVLAPRANPVEFVVAVGICTGVTALPVLGAILREMGLLDRSKGHLALVIAGLNDVALWILLGALLTAGNVAAEPGAFLSLGCAPLCLAVMMYIVRPGLGRLLRFRTRGGQVQEGALALVGAATIASALATEAVGPQYIIGALVMAS